MYTLINLERNLTWLEAGNKANTGATGATAKQRVKILDKIWTLFEVTPTAPYNDGYWYQKLQYDYPVLAYAMRIATDFTLGMHFKITEEDYANTRCVEFEVQQAISGKVWNMAWQGRIGGNWRYFDYVGKRWLDLKVPLPCAIKPDTDHHVYFEAKREGNYIQHISFNFDEVDQKIFPTILPCASKSVGDMLNIGFQLDTQAKLNPARATVRNMNLKWA